MQSHSLFLFNFFLLSHPLNTYLLFLSLFSDLILCLLLAAFHPFALHFLSSLLPPSPSPGTFPIPLALFKPTFKGSSSETFLSFSHLLSCFVLSFVSGLLFLKLFIYLAVADLGCSMWHLWSLLRHVRSLVVVCKLLVVACTSTSVTRD